MQHCEHDTDQRKTYDIKHIKLILIYTTSFDYWFLPPRDGLLQDLQKIIGVKYII